MAPPQKQFSPEHAASEKQLSDGICGSSGKRPITPARVLSVLGHWRYILREQSLRFSQPPPLQTPISWPLDPEQIKHLVVKWPAVYFDRAAEKFIEHVRLGMCRFVRVESSPIPQSYGGVINIELLWREKSYPIAIDISDTMADIQHDILNRSVLYFKL